MHRIPGRALNIVRSRRSFQRLRRRWPHRLAQYPAKLQYYLPAGDFRIFLKSWSFNAGLLGAYGVNGALFGYLFYIAGSGFGSYYMRYVVVAYLEYFRAVGRA